MLAALGIICLGGVTVNAKEPLINFDGNMPGEMSIIETVKSTELGQNDKLSRPGINPELVAENKKANNTGVGERVDVLIKIRDTSESVTMEKSVLCAKTGSQFSCQDKVTGAKLQQDEISSLLIGRHIEFDNTPYEKGAIFWPGMPNRGPYYTCSSGHSFYCVDFCKQWVVVETSGSWTVGPHGPAWVGTEKKECANWSYDCTDQGPDTCSGPTTPPSGGFTHPD